MAAAALAHRPSHTSPLPLTTVCFSRRREIVQLDDDQVKSAFKEFKKVADLKKVVTDEDLVALMDMAEHKELAQMADNWSLESVYVTSGNELTPSATVTMRNPDGNELTDAAVGVGAVDAVFKAVERIVETEFTLYTAPPSPPPAALQTGRQALTTVSLRQGRLHGASGDGFDGRAWQGGRADPRPGRCEGRERDPEVLGPRDAH